MKLTDLLAKIFANRDREFVDLSTQKSWKEFTVMGEESIREAHYTLAERHYNLALEALNKTEDKDEHLSFCLCNLALSLKSQGRYSESESLYKKAIKLDRKIQAKI